MARTEARVFCNIWNDPDWRTLSPDEQWLYLLLISQPDMTQAGTLGLAVRRWASASPEMTAERVWTALRGLHEKRYAIADTDTEEVLVRSVMRRDGSWKSYKTLTFAVRAGQALLSPRLRAVLLSEVVRINPDELKEDTPHAAKNRAHVYDLLGQLRRSLGGADGDPAGCADTPSDAPSVGLPIPHAIPAGAGDGAGELLHVPVTSNSSSTTSGASELRSEPASPAKPKRRTSTEGRGYRLPEDWQPSPADEAYAQVRGLDVVQLAEAFRDYWHAESGSRATKKDWHAAWRTWCRNEVERRQQRGNVHRGPWQGGKLTQATTDACRAGRMRVNL